MYFTYTDSHINVTRFNNLKAVTLIYRLTNVHLQTARHFLNIPLIIC